jgi:hypothetical protein
MGNGEIVKIGLSGFFLKIIMDNEFDEFKNISGCVKMQFENRSKSFLKYVTDLNESEIRGKKR